MSEQNYKNVGQNIMSDIIGNDVNNHRENTNKIIYDKKSEVPGVRSLKAAKLIDIRDGKIIAVNMNRSKSPLY